MKRLLVVVLFLFGLGVVNSAVVAPTQQREIENAHIQKLVKLERAFQKIKSIPHGCEAFENRRKHQHYLVWSSAYEVTLASGEKISIDKYAKKVRSEIFDTLEALGVLIAMDPGCHAFTREVFHSIGSIFPFIIPGARLYIEDRLEHLVIK